jgi:hypothetical protein
MGTGFLDACGGTAPQKCFDMPDGRQHPEWWGTVYMPWPGVQALAHELGHGLLGVQAEDFPAAGARAFNSGDGQHTDADMTLQGPISGPLWDPDRGYPKGVRLDDGDGGSDSVYIVREDDGTFHLKAVDAEKDKYGDFFLYMMGLKPAEDVTTTYYKLYNPQLTDCIIEGGDGNLLCTNDLVTAEEEIPFTVSDLIAKYGAWDTRHPFDPTNLQMGVLNISDRMHTEAEVTWFSMVYRDYATSTDWKCSIADDISWHHATQGLSSLNIDAQSMVDAANP